MSKIIPLLGLIIIGLGLLGGLLYLIFPPIGDASIITSCREMGGEPSWARWPEGCGMKECKFFICLITE